MSSLPSFARVLLCTASLLVGTVASAHEALNIYIGQGQMPFADDAAGNRGLFGDLMDELCRRMQRDCQYRSVPWRRVQLAASEDPHGIVLNLARTAEREDAFIWLLNVVPTAYVLAGRQRSFDSLSEALQAGPVAVMAGTPRALEVLALRRGNQAVVEVTDPEQAARMLKGGRVIAWYEIDLRAHYLWRQLDYPAHMLRTGRPIGLGQSYIAASQQLHQAEEISRQMRQAFSDMHEDGSWRLILTRHLGEGLADRIDPS